MRTGDMEPAVVEVEATAPPHVVEDCRGVLQVLSDGTVVRSSASPYAVEDRDDGRVEWRDAAYGGSRGLGVRMYRPKPPRERQGKKPLLRVLAYFHGGGFCIGSRAWPSVHACCLRLADEARAVVLSFDYRLGPEHRVPAAHDDAAAALLWLLDQLQSSSDPWLHVSAVDAHKVFVSGTSAGGGLAHHMAVRFGTAAGLSPAIAIEGYILLMPGFFSGQPTRSELETPETAWLTRDMFDRFFRLGMPAGATRVRPEQPEPRARASGPDARRRRGPGSVQGRQRGVRGAVEGHGERRRARRLPRRGARLLRCLGRFRRRGSEAHQAFR